jgi:diadenosine tetraphosphate (Ap4A) HIT family hydrolase
MMNQIAINKTSKLAITLLAICLVLFFSSLLQAQSSGQAARKFDEFGDIQMSDLKARLDNFAIQIQQEPGTRGFIITYRSHRDLPGLSSRLASPAKEYLINNRLIPAERIVTVDGGEAECLMYEFWIVPAGAAPKPRGDAYQRHFVDTTSAWKFDEYYYPLFDEYDEGDSVAGNSLEAFAEVLRKLPRSQAFILAYPQHHVERSSDPPNAALRMLKAVKAELVRKYKIAPSRIKVMNGGYRKLRQVELWIVPRGEHAPIPTPNSFPKKRR